MHNLNVHQFTDIARKFVTCQHTACGGCEYADECESMNEPSFAMQLADMLETILPALESYTELSAQEFIDLISGRIDSDS